MGRRVKPRWHRRRWETTRQIGEKKGAKRSLLVDGRGAPLSLIVAGANRHDVKLLGATLDAIVVERPKPTAGNRSTFAWTKATPESRRRRKCETEDTFRMCQRRERPRRGIEPKARAAAGSWNERTRG